MTETAVEQDLVDLLIQQHTQIRDLFTEAGSTAAATRWGAAHRLVRLLAVHEVVDEQVVYPLIRLHVHRNSRGCSPSFEWLCWNAPTTRRPTISATCVEMLRTAICRPCPPC